MATKRIGADSTAEINLRNSRGMAIRAHGGTATVHVHYKTKSGQYSSAIKGSASYSSPFHLVPGSPKSVLKSDLESEHVRVGTENATIIVTY